MLSAKTCSIALVIYRSSSHKHIQAYVCIIDVLTTQYHIPISITDLKQQPFQMSLKTSLILLTFLSAQFYVLDAMIDELDIFCRRNGVCTSDCGSFRCFHHLVTPSADGSEPDETIVLFKVRPQELLGNSVVYSIFDSFVPPQMLTFEDAPDFPLERNSTIPIDIEESSDFFKPGTPICVAEIKPPVETAITSSGLPVFTANTLSFECQFQYILKPESSKFEYARLYVTSTFGSCCDVCRHSRRV